MDENVYLPKAFLPEDIYLGNLPKDFRKTRREKKMDRPTKTNDNNKKNNWQDNNDKRNTLKA